MSAPALPEDAGLRPVLDDFHAAGFTTDLTATDGGVACSTCRSVSPACELLVHRIRRLEGTSDPADMLAVVGATCPGCHCDGTLVLAYGPAGDLADADVLAGLAVPEDVDAVGPAPGEVPSRHA
jgi:hypothetical protein